MFQIQVETDAKVLGLNPAWGIVKFFPGVDKPLGVNQGLGVAPIGW